MRGIITKAIGGFFFVADEKLNIYQSRIRGKIRERVYPGDQVEFQGEVIDKILPRKNLLFRPNIANVDQVLIIQSWQEPDLDFNLLDRFLLVVEAKGLKPVIVLNKIDFISAGQENLLAEYQKAGYEVFMVSAKRGQGLEELLAVLHGKVNVLTGPSGVGKSSLINSIIEGVQLKTGQVSKKLKRGKHTTRHVELLPIKEGGWVADTPGFTSLDIKHIAVNELPYLFPEFSQYLSECKFRGCSHTHEPKCAVKLAVKEGKISLRRYESYLKLYRELVQ